jgi:PilZ domain
MKEARVRSRSHKTAPICDRRADSRVPIDVRLMYSGQEEGEELIMGDGSVVDLSSRGLRIRGNVAVKPGLVMTLFVYLPDGRDPLFILSARVAWSEGHQFGAEILKINVRERNRLRYFLCSHLRQ